MTADEMIAYARKVYERSAHVEKYTGIVCTQELRQRKYDSEDRWVGFYWPVIWGRHYDASRSNDQSRKTVHDNHISEVAISDLWARRGPHVLTPYQRNGALWLLAMEKRPRTIRCGAGAGVGFAD